MENLAFHSLFRWKTIITPLLTSSLIRFSLGRLGERTFWTWEWKGQGFARNPQSSVHWDTVAPNANDAQSRTICTFLCFVPWIVWGWLCPVFVVVRALHLAAGLSHASDLMALLLTHGADVDAVNDDLCTPLFYATQANNMYAASLLITHGNGNRTRKKKISGVPALISPTRSLPFSFWVAQDHWGLGCRKVFPVSG